MSDKISLFQNQRTWAQIKSAVLDLIDLDHDQGQAQNGSLTHRLEQKLAQRFGRQHCVTTASCSDALTIAVLALNLPPGSRVAVSIDVRNLPQDPEELTDILSYLPHKVDLTIL
jgi:dTDP-4-amino-4,6-dideoxygalactose transaminase